MNTIKLQVGAFSVDAPIETAVQAVVLGEVQRTTNSIFEFGDVLKPDGVKGARSMWDQATCEYQSSLVEALKNDILKMKESCNAGGR